MLTVNGQPLGEPKVLPDMDLVNERFVELVEGLSRVQAETGKYFRVTSEPTAEDVAGLARIMQLLNGRELAIMARPLRITATPPLSGVERHDVLALQFWHAEALMGEEIPLGPCTAFGGPWEVRDVEPQGDEMTVSLSPTAETRLVLRRGGLTDTAVFPGGPVHVLMPQ
jgi:hypothetical protein